LAAGQPIDVRWKIASPGGGNGYKTNRTVIVQKVK